MRTRRSLAAVLVAGTALLAACGDDGNSFSAPAQTRGDSSSSAATAAPTDEGPRLTADGEAFLARRRELLGFVPVDAVWLVGFETGDPSVTFDEAATRDEGFLGSAFGDYTTPFRQPWRDVVAGRPVAAGMAVRSSALPVVIVELSSGKAADIADDLVAAGYRRDGDLVLIESGRRLAGGFAVLSDSVFAYGRRPAVEALLAAAPSESTSPLVTMFANVPGRLRVANVRPNESCGRYIAIGQDVVGAATFLLWGPRLAEAASVSFASWGRLWQGVPDIAVPIRTEADGTRVFDVSIPGTVTSPIASSIGELGTPIRCVGA